MASRYGEYKYFKSMEGEDVFFFGRVSSTMDIAGEFIKEGRTAVIVADEQARGRGRYGRFWFSPGGGLYFSWAMKGEGRMPFFISELAAFSLLETIRFFKIICNIKFPNDIISENGKKLAGILIEKKGSFYNIGIGINVNNNVSFADSATSMCLAAGKPFYEKEGILRRFILLFNANKKQFTENEVKCLKKWSDNLIK